MILSPIGGLSNRGAMTLPISRLIDAQSIAAWIASATSCVGADSAMDKGFFARLPIITRSQGCQAPTRLLGSFSVRAHNHDAPADSVAFSARSNTLAPAFPECSTIHFYQADKGEQAPFQALHVPDLTANWSNRTNLAISPLNILPDTFHGSILPSKVQGPNGRLVPFDGQNLKKALKRGKR